VEVGAEPAQERLQQALEAFGRHEDARPRALRGLSPEVRDAVERDRGLAVPRLAEDEERAVRRPQDGVALRGRELDVDEGRRAAAGAQGRGGELERLGLEGGLHRGEIRQGYDAEGSCRVPAKSVIINGAGAKPARVSESPREAAEARADDEASLRAG